MTFSYFQLRSVGYIASYKLNFQNWQHWKCLIPRGPFKYNKHIHENTKWITAGIMKSKTFSDNLNHRLKTTPRNTILYQTVKHNISSYNRILQKLIRNAKKTYCYSCFTKYKNDLKNTWITIKKHIEEKKEY